MERYRVQCAMFSDGTPRHLTVSIDAINTGLLDDLVFSAPEPPQLFNPGNTRHPGNNQTTSTPHQIQGNRDRTCASVQYGEPFCATWWNSHRHVSTRQDSSIIILVTVKLIGCQSINDKGIDVLKTENI
jgi:hypothetical protein